VTLEEQIQRSRYAQPGKDKKQNQMHVRSLDYAKQRRVQYTEGRL
jgi:hypothetical protein